MTAQQAVQVNYFVQILFNCHCCKKYKWPCRLWQGHTSDGKTSQTVSRLKAVIWTFYTGLYKISTCSWKESCVNPSWSSNMHSTIPT